MELTATTNEKSETDTRNIRVLSMPMGIPSPTCHVMYSFTVDTVVFYHFWSKRRGYSHRAMCILKHACITTGEIPWEGLEG